MSRFVWVNPKLRERHSEQAVVKQPPPVSTEKQLTAQFFREPTTIQIAYMGSPRLPEYLGALTDGSPIGIKLRWTEEAPHYPWLIQLGSTRGVLIVVNTAGQPSKGILDFLGREVFFGYQISGQEAAIRDYFGIQVHTIDIVDHFLKSDQTYKDYPSLVESFIGPPNAPFHFEGNGTGVWTEANLQEEEVYSAALEVHSLVLLVPFLKKLEGTTVKPPVPIGSIKKYISPSKKSTLIQICKEYSSECSMNKTEQIRALHLLANKCTREEIVKSEGNKGFECLSCKMTCTDVTELVEHVARIHMDEDLPYEDAIVVDLCVVNGIIKRNENFCKVCNCVVDNIEEHCLDFHSDQLLTLKQQKFLYHVYADYLCQELCCGVHGEGVLYCNSCRKHMKSNSGFVRHQIIDHFTPIVVSRDEFVEWPVNNKYFECMGLRHNLDVFECIRSGIVDEDGCRQCGVSFERIEDARKHIERFHLAFIPDRMRIEFGEGKQPINSYRSILWRSPNPVDVAFYDTFVPVRVVKANARILPFILKEMHDGGEVSVDFEWAPIFYKNKVREIIDVMQIATTKGVLIVLWEKDGNKSALLEFFSEEVLYGKGVSSDTEKLKQLFGVDIVIRDIESIFLSPHGLSLNFVKTVENFLGKPSAEFKNKRITISNWAKRPLTAEQILYSAFDAYAVHEMLPKLKALG